MSLNLTGCLRASRSCGLIAAALMFVGAFAGTPARAGTDPTVFISSLGNQLQTIAVQPSPVQRQPGFRHLFEEDFDVPGISRFVLGRFSRVLTPGEQQQFVCYFEDYVVLSFSDRLSQFVADGAVFKVIGSRPGSDGVIVFSQISRGTAQGIRVDCDNDPHGEHDFGNFEVAGHKLFFQNRLSGQEAPADPSKTTRVLTIRLASEY